MGVPFTMAHGSIRFSLSIYNTEEEVDRAIAAVEDVTTYRTITPGKLVH